MNPQPANRPSTTPDYAIGDPIPAPVAVEENSAEVRLKWLRAVAAMERRVNFAPTAPARLT